MLNFRSAPPFTDKEIDMSRLPVLAASACLLASIVSGCATPPPAATRTIAVSGAPKAAGPYAQGVVANGFLYTAGMISRDPVSNELVQGDIKVHTTRVLDSLEAILAGAGCSLKDVVKVTVYMADIADFAKMNEVYAARFGDNKPARTTIQAAKLPGGSTLEMDLVARIP
jgi:2-iminobutanoate/2-iminopropanoate deaminase